MKLIHFAHRQEGKEFLERENFTPVEFMGLELYQMANTLLLISGEGIYESLKKVSLILGHFKISEYLNLGIAGALNTKLPLEHIYEIRTVYGHTNKPEFHSFELSKSGLDLITNNERVLSDELRDKLSPFADLVDLELWGALYALKGINIKKNSYKLVSDYAGNSTICSDVKERSEIFAIKLYEHYLSLNKEKNSTLEETSEDFPFQDFYMTAQQKIKLQDLYLKLKSNPNINFSDLIEKFKNAHPRPKEATKALIDYLSTLQNPLKTKIEEKVKNVTSSLQNVGVKISCDPQFEKISFKLSMDINSQGNVRKLKDALEDFNFNKFEEIFEGNLDV